MGYVAPDLYVCKGCEKRLAKPDTGYCIRCSTSIYKP